MVDRDLPGGFAALRQFVQKGRVAAGDGQEYCEFCTEPIPSEHRHMLATASQEVLCVCQPCSILFDKREASEGRYCLVPDRRLALDEFQMDSVQWASLNIPVEMAFFVYSTPAERVRVYYPSPMGPAESPLKMEIWQALVATNPLLDTMAADVEALLVNRTHHAPGYFLVPIDDCYRLVALLRAHWKGLGGGQEVWDEIERFFTALRARAQKISGSEATMMKGNSP